MDQTHELLLARQNALIKQSREKIRALSAQINQPIAIVGMGCRVPSADNVEALWELLQQGDEAISEVPLTRWDIDDYYDPNPGTPEKTYSRRAGYLSDIEQFDARFFGISPREARQMDPQQRLLMEVSYHALENAMISAERLRNEAVGVFVGISSSEYGAMTFSGDRDASPDAYSITGTSLNSAAGRLAYYYGFNGPALAIDTACSSSLVAIYQACRSLVNQECHTALAGGVNTLLSPGPTVALAQNKVLSASGHCSPFSHDADGLVRGEGCGVLVLKRLEDAVAEKCQILAVIRSGHVNQDGASSGLTVPNGYAQQSLIKTALKVAQVDPAAIQYVETHGTGTELGDPIEAKALRQALCQEQVRQSPLLIGSIKANIGHLEAASGVAGVIKVVLALKHHMLPKQINVAQKSTLIYWGDDLDIVNNSTPLTYDPEHPFYAGVSSFGFSGTNAHLILQDPVSAVVDVEAPQTISPVLEKSTSESHAFLGISAKDPQALKLLLQDYSEYFASERDWQGACAAVNAGRSQYPYRAGFVATDRQTLVSQLKAASHNEDVREPSLPPLVTWLFTGQGSQYVQMGKVLFETQPDFRRWLEHADAAIQPHLGRSILSVIWHEAAQLNDTQYTQPAIFCLQYALAQFLSTRVGMPQYVLGHSIGEYAAAVVAGIFDLDDAARMIVARGRLMVERCSPGGMMVVFADRQQVEELLTHSRQDVSLAVVNGPKNHVLSGSGEAIQHLAQIAGKRDIRCVSLPVSHAFHSSMMTPMLREFEAVVQQTNFNRPQISFISTALGRSVDEELLDSSYWVSQVSGAVLFEQAIAALTAEPDWQDASSRLCVELGPHRQLIDMARMLPDTSDAQWLNMLQSGNNHHVCYETMRSLYLAGLPFQWPEISAYKSSQPLPQYPFIRQPYWLEGERRRNVASANLDYDVVWNHVLFSQAGDTYLKSENEQNNFCLVCTEQECQLAAALSNSMAQIGTECQIVAPKALIQDGSALDHCHSVILYMPDGQAPPESQTCFETLSLIVQMTQDRVARTPRLVIVVDSGEQGYRPLASGLAGLCRTVREETSFDLTLIGLDDRLDVTRRAQMLAAEIHTPRCGDWERRLVDDQVLVPRLVSASQTDTHQRSRVNVHPERSYLVTGGTGTLGRLFAEMLLEQGAKDLILLVRQTEHHVLNELRTKSTSLGARLSVYGVDLTDGDAIQNVFEVLKNTHLPLAGIIHAAGQLSDAAFNQLNAESFARAFDVKAVGGWWLDRLSEDMPLDFFVMTSSIASVLGAVGQANYASANGYLDGLALQRYEQGKPVMSIRLGAVADTGMTAHDDVKRQLRRMGIKPLPLSVIRHRCAAWLGASSPLSMLAEIDWPRVRAREGETARPFLTEMLPPINGAITQSMSSSLSGNKGKCQREQIETIVIDTIAAILGISESDQIGKMDTLNALGMDSVTLVELREQLQLQLGAEIPTRFLFDFPQVGKLIRHLQIELHDHDNQQRATEGYDSTSETLPAESDEQASRRDIAIVGIACRFPGSVNSPEAFWSALKEGRDLVGEIDALRWDVRSLMRQGQLVTARAGIIDHLDAFDCGLFGITPREAQCMDPQQRLLLEAGWEALERAGYDFSATDVLGGIFIGPGPDDYAKRFPTDAATLSHHHSTGNALSVTAGRLAFTLDWQGPTLAVDTACSSSLMAVHLATQALRQGECSIALAGGVNLLLSPETSVLLSKGSMLAPDGRCKTFDAKANGYVRSEGCGLVVLKCLKDAVADGDDVIAVIRGSASNQDGHSQGLTAPNGQSQQRVLRRALRDAAVDPTQVELLEAHGTGTPLGDPIEMSAAQAVYAERLSRHSPLWVSSVKTNMGHAEAAAGIAGLIKTALCLYHQTIVPHLHLAQLNPEIQLDDTVRIPDTTQPWPHDGTERYAAVSSFGFSGTNVHMILQSAPERASISTKRDTPDGLRISAATKVALNDMMHAYLDRLVVLPAKQYEDFCQQSWRRAELAHTRIFAAAPQGEMIAELRSILESSHTVTSVGHQTSALSMLGGSLPCYPFQRQHFWQPLSAVRKERSNAVNLGVRLGPRSATKVVYAVDYLNQPPFNLEDHLVHNEFVVPAAAHLALIIGMLRDLRGSCCWEVLDVLCEGTFIPDAETEVALYEFTTITEDEGEAFSIEVLSEHSEGIRTHLRARAKSTETQAASIVIPVSNPPLTEINAATFYDELYSSEIALSHEFRSIVSIQQFVGYSKSEMRWYAGDSGPLVPGELDSLLQTIALATKAEQPGTSHMSGATIPVTIDRLLVASLGDREAVPNLPFICQTRLNKEDRGAAFVHDIALSVEGEQPFLSIEGLCTRWVSAQQIKPIRASSAYLNEAWVAEPLATPLTPSEEGAPIYVLLNTVEDEIDPDFASALAPLNILHHPTTQVVEQTCRERHESHDVVLIYCLSQYDPHGSVANSDGMQGMMALVSAVRYAHNLSETLFDSGIATRFQVLSKEHAHPIGKVSGSPLFGFASGLCKSLSLEWSNCSVGMLDVDTLSLQQNATLLENEWCQMPLSWVCYHQEHRYVRRIGEFAGEEIVGKNAFHCRDTGLYLLTGGLGALALETCKWLLSHGARRFLLLGRRAENEQISQRLQELHDTFNAQFEYRACDVSDRTALETLLAEEQISDSLCGIFHCAGTLSDGAFSSLTDDDFAHVMRSKVIGSWNLHTLTQDMSLDCFVLYSSLASLLGAAGQSNYAAANGFMDQLAHYRHALGLPALALNWSGWDEIGMAAGKTSETGLRLLNPARAIMDLERLMSSDVIQAGVIDVDWSIFSALGHRPIPGFVQHWIESHQVDQTDTDNEKEDNSVNLLEELRALPSMARLDSVKSYLRQITRKIMKLDEESELDDQKPFQDFGFDSLMSIELKQKLYKKLRIRVPATLIFDYPNVESLATYIMQTLEPDCESTEKPLPDTNKHMDELDEEQLAHILETLL